MKHIGRGSQASIDLYSRIQLPQSGNDGSFNELEQVAIKTYWLTSQENGYMGEDIDFDKIIRAVYSEIKFLREL